MKLMYKVRRIDGVTGQKVNIACRNTLEEAKALACSWAFQDNLVDIKSAYDVIVIIEQEPNDRKKLISDTVASFKALGFNNIPVVKSKILRK